MKKLILLSVFVTGILQIAYAQENEFILGSYLTSSDTTEITYYQNYWQVKQMGMNTAIQRSIVDIAAISQEKNFDSLMQFSTIIALNDSGFAAGVHPDNVDWIYYFTNALYNKWEAEGSPYFGSNEPVGVKHNGIGYSAADGWSSGDNPNDIGKYFML